MQWYTEFLQISTTCKNNVMPTDMLLWCTLCTQYTCTYSNQTSLHVINHTC